MNLDDMLFWVMRERTAGEQKYGSILRSDHQLIAYWTSVAFYFLGKTTLNLLSCLLVICLTSDGRLLELSLQLRSQSHCTSVKGQTAG